MVWKIPSEGPLRTLLDYLQIILGATLIGLGTNWFFVPNRVVSGGVTGIAILMHYGFETPVGLVNLLLNIPMMVIGWRWAGGTRFLLRTVVAVVVMSAVIDLSSSFLVPPTHDRLLVICYGGLLDGLGLGLVFRARGTTGGTDVLARIAHRYLGLGIGQTILALNVVIFAAAAFEFGAESVMVALALAFVSAKILDTVQSGFSVARQAIILTEKPGRVRDAVFRYLGRGVTFIEATGGYSGEVRSMVYVVVAAHEVARLKMRIAEVDPGAFVAISKAQEVLGEGFSPASQKAE